jgi:myosin-crossreactive antigen
MRAFSSTGLRKAEHAEETFEEFTERYGQMTPGGHTGGVMLSKKSEWLINGSIQIRE